MSEPGKAVCAASGCGNTARLGRIYCGRCEDLRAGLDAEDDTYYQRKQVLNDIRMDLGLALGEFINDRQRAYYIREAVSKLTQLVEDLHDLA